MSIGAVYRRYASKEELLRRLSAAGLQQYIAAVEDALAQDDGDLWSAFAAFMRRIVDADTHSLTLRLAGTFTPTDELNREAARAQNLNVRLFERTKAAGAIRPDIEVGAISLLLASVVRNRTSGCLALLNPDDEESAGL